LRELSASFRPCSFLVSLGVCLFGDDGIWRKRTQARTRMRFAQTARRRRV
jgi:hypothetical protein